MPSRAVVTSLQKQARPISTHGLVVELQFRGAGADELVGKAQGLLLQSVEGKALQNMRFFVLADSLHKPGSIVCLARDPAPAGVPPVEPKARVQLEVTIEHFVRDGRLASLQGIGCTCTDLPHFLATPQGRWTWLRTGMSVVVPGVGLTTKSRNEGACARQIRHPASATVESSAS